MDKVMGRIMKKIICIIATFCSNILIYSASKAPDINPDAATLVYTHIKEQFGSAPRPAIKTTPVGEVFKEFVDRGVTGIITKYPAAALLAQERAISLRFSDMVKSTYDQVTAQTADAAPLQTRLAAWNSFNEAFENANGTDLQQLIPGFIACATYNKTMLENEKLEFPSATGAKTGFRQINSRSLFIMSLLITAFNFDHMATKDPAAFTWIYNQCLGKPNPIDPAPSTALKASAPASGGGSNLCSIM